jgi:hypothetical protein
MYKDKEVKNVNNQNVKTHNRAAQKNKEMSITDPTKHRG